MLNIFSERREKGDIAFTVRVFWMVCAIWKVIVIGQMSVSAFVCAQCVPITARGKDGEPEAGREKR